MNYVTYTELFQLLSLLMQNGTFVVALIALVISLNNQNKKK